MENMFYLEWVSRTKTFQSVTQIFNTVRAPVNSSAHRKYPFHL